MAIRAGIPALAGHHDHGRGELHAVADLGPQEQRDGVGPLVLAEVVLDRLGQLERVGEAAVCAQVLLDGAGGLDPRGVLRHDVVDQLADDRPGRPGRPAGLPGRRPPRGRPGRSWARDSWRGVEREVGEAVGPRGPVDRWRPRCCGPGPRSRGRGRRTPAGSGPRSGAPRCGSPRRTPGRSRAGRPAARSGGGSTGGAAAVVDVVGVRAPVVGEVGVEHPDPQRRQDRARWWCSSAPVPWTGC